MFSRRLSEVGPLSLDEITRVAVTLARQIARLHDEDIVHGHIRPSRVTLTETTVELDPPDGVGFSKPHDVRSCGELTLWLLSRSGLPTTGPLAEAARVAAALDPASRPTAGELARNLERVLMAPDAAPPVLPSRRRLRLPLKSIVVGALAVAGVTVMAAAWSSLRPAAAPAPAEPANAAPEEPAPRRVARLPAQVWPESAQACADVVAPLAADLDGDGCDEEIQFDNGRFRGAAGAVEVRGAGVSQHVTGDWHCSGTSTLASLDTSTGAVFVFPRWARPGDDVQAAMAARVPSAISLLSGDADGDGCDDLRAVTSGSDEVAIDVPVEVQP